jgi:predicted dithiol-disulfide oxidoreductase (DUF899 family)
MKKKTTTLPKVVSPARWLAARRKLLREEKAFTRLGDKLAARRQQLPWVKIEKDYVFDSSRGRVKLADLFGGRRQLIVQHFMLGPGWEEGCKSCSFMMDHFVPTVTHLAARDVSFTAISHAPLAEIQRFRKRMGWDVNWVSANGTDFNQDFHVTFTEEEIAKGKVNYNFAPRKVYIEQLPGVSVFAQDAAGTVYHTYSTYGRGVELIMATYDLLDIVPKGRDEAKLDYGMEWVRHHDRYDHVLAKV